MIHVNSTRNVTNFLCLRLNYAYQMAPAVPMKCLQVLPSILWLSSRKPSPRKREDTTDLEREGEILILILLGGIAIILINWDEYLKK